MYPTIELYSTARHKNNLGNYNICLVTVAVCLRNIKTTSGRLRGLQMDSF